MGVVVDFANRMALRRQRVDDRRHLSARSTPTGRKIQQLGLPSPRHCETRHDGMQMHRSLLGSCDSRPRRSVDMRGRRCEASQLRQSNREMGQQVAIPRRIAAHQRGQPPCRRHTAGERFVVRQCPYWQSRHVVDVPATTSGKRFRRSLVSVTKRRHLGRVWKNLQGQPAGGPVAVAEKNGASAAEFRAESSL